MIKPAIVFVHSPFVAASTWAGVARAFASQGYVAVAPSLEGVMASERPCRSALVEIVAGACQPLGETVLVVHSGAGGLVDAIASSTSLAAAIYVDAILPHPGRSWLSTVPPDLRRRLLQLSDAGRLPAWDQWLPAGAIDKLLPDPECRAEFLAGIPRVPLAFADEIVPPRTGSGPRSNAYLRLSEGYEAEAQAAEALGWPTIREECHHLAMVSEPVRVAQSLRRLLQFIGIGL